jgi:outer membrane receptor protein involved in Fe transport
MTSKTFELSVNQKIGKDLSITLTAYKTQIDNLIQVVSDNGHTDLYNNKFLGWPVDYIAVPYNQGSQKNYGGNLIVNSTQHVGKLKLNTYSSISYSQGRLLNAATGEKEVEQLFIVPWLFRAGVDGKVDAFHFSVRLLKAGQQRMARFMDSPNADKRQTIDGYSLLNLSAGYTFNDKATFFVNVQNALNKEYLNGLSWDSTEIDGSLQNPLRIMAGIRIGF